MIETQLKNRKTLTFNPTKLREKNLKTKPCVLNGIEDLISKFKNYSLEYLNF